MSADLPRARQLVRLRDITLEAAMRDLAAATATLADAEAATEVALGQRDGCRTGLAATRAALVDHPDDAAAGLARIAHARDRLAAAEQAVEVAEEARRLAEDAVIAARTAARRANARRDAMVGQAGQLRLADLRRSEERTAIESEETAAARMHA